MINPLALIPHYNHSFTLDDLLYRLQAQQLPCLIVDDGSAPEHRQRAAALAEKYGCQLLQRAENGGKGAAVKDGIFWAQARGYSHVLQLDADGQHRPEDAPALLQAGMQQPEAMVCGQPQYGEDAPKSRLYGRKITNFWLRVNTGSDILRDGMCGYRLYPVSATVKTLQKHKTGNRMDFDIEILVLLCRRGVPFVWVAVPVHYQPDGVSHFRLWRDNLRISAAHARLFFSGIGWRLWGR